MLREIVIGSPAFWCPETPNYVVGVCAELVIVAGHSRTFVWAMPSGAPVGVWTRRDLHLARAITCEGDHVLVDLPDRRLRVVAATGATVGEEAAMPAASLRIDNARTRMTLTSPGGVDTVRDITWTRDGAIARDGARYALDGQGRAVRVYDAATHELVYTAPMGGTPRLSADGRYLVVSMLGPPRAWVVDVDRGEVVTPAEPPGIFTVTLGHPSLCVVDDGVWSLAGEGAPQRVTTVEAWGAQRVIRGESIVGVGLDGGSGSRGAIGRWRLRDGACEARLEIPARKLWSASVDAAGRTVALTLDDSHGLLALYPEGVWIADLDAGTLVRISDDEGPAATAIAPAGDAIAIIDERGERLRVVDRAGAVLLTPVIDAKPRWAQFAPDGERLLVVADVVFWDARVAEINDRETAFLVDRAGNITTVGAGTWRGWLGDSVVRRAGEVLERVDPATGTVTGTAAVEAGPSGPSRDGHAGLSETRARVWLDEHRVALAANDGCLRLRDLVWRTVGP